MKPVHAKSAVAADAVAVVADAAAVADTVVAAADADTRPPASCPTRLRCLQGSQKWAAAARIVACRLKIPQSAAFPEALWPPRVFILHGTADSPCRAPGEPTLEAFFAP